MPETPKICVYCGDWYECRDHVRPICNERVYRDYRSGETVPCCNLCNRLAGSFPAEDIRDKAMHLIRRYEQRYARVLQLPVWTQEDMRHLKGSLRARIRRNDLLRQLIRSKLLNLDLVMLGYEPQPIDRKLIVLEPATSTETRKQA